MLLAERKRNEVNRHTWNKMNQTHKSMDWYVKNKGKNIRIHRIDIENIKRFDDFDLKLCLKLSNVNMNNSARLYNDLFQKNRHFFFFGDGKNGGVEGGNLKVDVTARATAEDVTGRIFDTACGE